MPPKPSALYLIDAERLDYIYAPRERALIEQHLAFVGPRCAPRSWSEIGEERAKVEAIVTSWGMPRLDERFLAHFPRLKIVFYGAGSVREFVTEASWARGVRVVSASAANAVSAAEFAFAQIILALKQTWPQVAAIKRERRFFRSAERLAGTYDSTVGLLALGQIGRLVADRLKTLAVTTLAYDPLVTPAQAAALGVTLCSLEDVFSRSDVVSCHLPLLPATTRLLREVHFRSMQPGTAFINTARGAVVAEDELVAVLRERPDLCAILDVTDPEPPLPGSVLFELPNVVLTPHTAGCVGRECRRLGASIAADVVRYVRSEPIANEVTPALAATMA